MSLADWRAARLSALRAQDGWLNLVARIDLTPGTHLVGRTQTVALPSGPDLLGTLNLGLDTASFARPGEDARPFMPVADAFPQLLVAPFLLEIHTVDGVPALRVRDLSQHPVVRLRYYPESPEWRIVAAWEEVASEMTSVAMKGGTTAPVMVTHRARFSASGRDWTLTPTHWKSGKPMFVFRDATAGETYPACRFLIGEDARDGWITLDFNRAFTPPCGFTDFAVCPLPPADNILPFRIEAGELAP